MQVKQLTVGPILGATDTTSVRIFGRSEFEIDGDRPRRAHGVIRIRKKGNLNFSAPIFFKMNPNFDMTGLAIVSGLHSNTNYEYQMGWFYSEVESADIDVANILVWEQIETVGFRTASADSEAPRVLVTGSCRYVLKLFDGMWFDDRGDKTFRSILRCIENGERIDQFIMCGDQIYADDLNVIGADTGVDEFNKRYRAVFTTKYLRRLMGQVPTYMTLDDHEIEDNWPSFASEKDWVTKFPSAIHAYSTYQASHSPLFKINNNRLEDTPTHLWYTYQDGCCDIFVSDTRTERLLDKITPEMLGPKQMKRLLEWLKDGSGRVKVVVSSVPLYESESSDKWNGFIAQRDKILETIRKNGVNKVIFISGDVHACMSSELVVGSDNSKIVSVVSSAFFWPYPHPKRRGFKLKGLIETKTGSQYQIANASKVYPTDAFTKLSIKPSGVHVEFFSRKGKRLGKKEYKF